MIQKHLSKLLNGHAGTSTEMAIRLSNAFGDSPEGWLPHHMQYDLRQAREEGEPDVERFAAA